MSEPYPSGATRVAPATSTTSTDPSAASIGTLVSEIAGDLSTLMQQELELAKVEVKAEISKAGKAAGMFGAAGFAGYMAILLLSFALAFAIGDQIGLGWGALIVGLLWAAAGAVLGLRGKQQAKTIDPTPRRTVQTVKEDAQWARHPRS